MPRYKVGISRVQCQTKGDELHTGVEKNNSEYSHNDAIYNDGKLIDK